MKLNKGQTYDILPEEGESASRTAPSGAKYVSVDKVGGKSIVWNQQIDTSGAVLITRGGVTVSKKENGKLFLSGTATGGIAWCIVGSARLVQGHKYIAKKIGENVPLRFDNLAGGAGLNFTDGLEVMTLTQECKSNVYAPVPDGVSVDFEISPFIVDLTLMFGAGNEPTAEQFEAMLPAESYPYNPGEIISGTTASIDLIPGNIYPGTQSVKYYPCKIAKGETFTASATCGQSDVKCRFASEDGSQKDYFSLSTGVGGGRYKRVISAQFDIAIVMFDVATGKEASGFVVEMGEGDGTYKKYFEPSQLPTSFPELRSARAAHDYIDMNGGKIRRNVGVVDLETLNWTYSDKYRWIISRDLIGIIATPATSIDIPNAISNTFDIVEQKNNTTLPGLCVWSNGPVTIKSENITSAADLSGAVLQYELATPTTEPVAISEPLQEWLPVEPGGTVTFRNSDESKQMAVPNSISWVRKLDEVN